MKHLRTLLLIGLLLATMGLGAACSSGRGGGGCDGCAGSCGGCAPDRNCCDGCRAGTGCTCAR